MLSQSSALDGRRESVGKVGVFYIPFSLTPVRTLSRCRMFLYDCHLLLSARMNVTTNDSPSHCSLSTTHCHFMNFVNICHSIIPCMDRHWRGRQLTYPRECCCSRVIGLALSLALFSRDILLLLPRSPDSANEERASLLVIDHPFGLTGGQPRTPEVNTGLSPFLRNGLSQVRSCKLALTKEGLTL